ncbi:hypothetical protein [Methylobacter marinus]|uniref:hypothetical protein n=1 Tax=Methylobacter marinus TaxID=34058 RepID=UPI00036A196C|nr:hypothetical protein [Methylobacter marinus]
MVDSFLSLMCRCATVCLIGFYEKHPCFFALTGDFVLRSLALAPFLVPAHPEGHKWECLPDLAYDVPLSQPGIGSHGGQTVKELVKSVIKSLIHHEDHEGHEEKIKLINNLKLRVLRVLRG